MPTTAGSQVTLAKKGATGQTGPQGASGTGAQGLWQPSDNLVVGANLDPSACGTNFNVAAGTRYFQRVRLSTDSTISSIKLLSRTPQGAGLANTFVGLYDTAGNLLAQTADVSTALQAGSALSVNLASPLSTQAAGTVFYVGLVVGSGTTMPILQGPQGTNANYGLSGTTLRGAVSVATGHTTLPSTVNLGSGYNPSPLFWVALGA